MRLECERRPDGRWAYYQPGDYGYVRDWRWRWLAWIMGRLSWCSDDP